MTAPKRHQRGIFVHALLAICLAGGGTSCGHAATDATCGVEGHACCNSTACNAGLVCDDKVCLAPADSGSATGRDSGTEDAGGDAGAINTGDLDGGDLDGGDPLDAGLESDGGCGGAGQACCGGTSCDADGRLFCSSSSHACLPAHDWTQWHSAPPDVAPGDYSDNGDETVTDEVTGLVWQESTPSFTLPWDLHGGAFSAQAYCNSLTLGHRQTGWRLPTLSEVMSLIDLDGSVPAINPTFFPDTISNVYWTSTPYAGAATDAWAVVFNTGTPYNYGQTEPANIRCVWTDPTGYEPWQSASAPLGRYDYPGGTVGQSETVHDAVTGLTWQRDLAPATGTGPGAAAYCAGLSLGGSASGWRLPSLKELTSIVNVAAVDPAVDLIAFPGTTSNLYWTSTAPQGAAAGYWLVSFWDGSIGGPIVFDAGGTADVRCVR